MSDYLYEPVSDGIKLTEYLGTDREDVEVPESIDELSVTVIGIGTFDHNGEGIKRLTIPSTVRKIESSGIEGCIDLKELVLNEGLQVIGSDFLCVNTVSEVEIPTTVYRIDEPWNLNVKLKIETGNQFHMSDDYAIYRRLDDGMLTMEGIFPNIKKKKYTIPDGCTAIEEHAFENLEELSVLNIPASMKTIEEGSLTSLNHPFEYRRGIKDIVVDQDNRLFFTQDEGLYYRKGQTYELIRYFGDDSEITLPDGLTELGMHAFLNAPVIKVTLPKELKTIHEAPFRGTMIEEVRFMDTDTVICFPGKAYRSLQEELVAEFGHNGTSFDYEDYDRLVCTEYLNADRIRLFANRLEYPVQMSAPQHERYELILKKYLQDALKQSGDASDTDTILSLCRIGIINSENASECVDTLSRCKDKGPMRALMDYIHDHFQSANDSDFSL